jgi:hypothetical protein
MASTRYLLFSCFFLFADKAIVAVFSEIIFNISKVHATLWYIVFLYPSANIYNIMKPHPGMDTGVPVTVCRKNLTLVTQGC